MRDGNVQSQKRRLRGILPVCRHSDRRQYLSSNKDGASVFSGLLSGRTRCNGHKEKDRKPHLNARETFFTVKMVKHWRVKESSSLEILRTQLDMVLNKLL